MPRAVLLDLDDTLVDRRAAMRRYCRRLLEGSGPVEAPAAALAAMLERDRDGYVDRRRWCGWLAQAYPALGWSADPLHDDYQATFPQQFSRDERVCAFVRELTRRSRVAVVTNGDGPMQRAKLAHSGLADCVEAVFISGELGVSKPAAAIFEHALAWAGCQAGHALFVGDHPRNDIAGAAACGLRTCWVGRGAFPGGPALPDMTIGHILELPEALSCLTPTA